MDRIAIRFGGYQRPASIHTQAAKVFGDSLKRRLGPRIAFELEGNVLDIGHKSGDLLPMVEQGTFTMCYISTIRFSKALPEFQLFEIPFLAHDRGKIFGALDGPLGQFLKTRIHDNTPYRVLGFWDNGFRHISNSLHPIRTPTDCRGVRIRTQMSEFIGAVFRRIGFEPVALDIKLLLDSIEAGEVDAQENPLTSIYTYGIQEFHRYITLTGHLFGVVMLLCNAAAYESWPQEVRDAVRAAADEATREQRRLAAAQDAEVMKALDPEKNEVIELSDAERAAFVEAVAPLVAEYRRKLDPKLFEYLA